VVLSIAVASVDSGIAQIFGSAPERIRERVKAFQADSLRSSDYWGRVVREEFGGAIGRFVDGFMNKRKTVADTLVIGGVLESQRHGHLRMGDLIIPISTARKFNSSGFSGDPTQLLSAAQGGNLFAPEADSSSTTFTRATVKMAPDALYQPIRDSIKAAGFRAVSFAEEFGEMRRFFRYFNLALGMVGIIALFTASLGIVNTMVMSITERRREIGVWMSLGADMWDIRRLFLFESGLIGLIGATGGDIAYRVTDCTHFHGKRGSDADGTLLGSYLAGVDIAGLRSGGGIDSRVFSGQSRREDRPGRSPAERVGT
jgi:hypothetical protein